MNFLQRLFNKKLDSSELLIRTIEAWLGVSNWQKSLGFLEEHPELFTNDAATTLAQLSAKTIQSTRLEALAHWVLLRDCRQNGSIVAYESRLQEYLGKNHDTSRLGELNYIIPKLSLGGRRFPPSDKQISEAI